MSTHAVSSAPDTRPAAEVTITDVRAHIVRSPRMTDDITRDEAMIVEVSTDVGISGWAEADGQLAPLKALVEYERPHPNDRGARHGLIGKPLDDLDELIKAVRFHTFRSGRTGLGRTAVATIETAIVDLVGKVTGMPAWRLLPGAGHTPAKDDITPYITIYHPGPYEEMFANARDDVDRGLAFGYRAFKLEATGYNTSLEEAIRYVEDMRAHVGDDVKLFVDTTYRWHQYEPAATAAKAYAELGVTFLEDPFPADRFELWRQLGEEVGIPLATGGGMETRPLFLAAMELGNVPIMQPGVHLAGLLGAHEVAGLARERGRRVVPFAYCATTLAAAGTMHLAAANANVEYVEYAPPELFPEGLLRAEIAGPEPKLENGRFRAPTVPGIGPECDRDALARYRVEQ